MNCIQLTGNLCKDMKINYTNNNKAYLENTIGVSKEKTDEQGNKQSDFINFVVFEKKAEYLNQYAKKGDKIELVGKLRVDNWQDKDGSYKQRIYVVADKVQILNSRPKNQEKPF